MYAIRSYYARLLSWPAKLRVLGELFVRPRRSGPEETLQQFGYSYNFV